MNNIVEEIILVFVKKDQNKNKFKLKIMITKCKLYKTYNN